MKTVRYILLGCVWAWAGLPDARAQYSIDPLRTELRGRPGQTLSGRLTVQSPSDRSAVVDVTFEDHSAEPMNGLAWLDFPSGRHTLEAGRPLVLDYRVTIPEQAAGELYGRVVFAEAPKDDEGMISISTRISVPLYVAIEGTETYTGRVERIRVLQVNPLRLAIDVLNEGNLHVRSHGYVDVARTATRENVLWDFVGTAPAVFYPGQSREILFKSSDRLPPGDYTARVRFPFPDTARPLSDTVHFTVPPIPDGQGVE